MKSKKGGLKPQNFAQASLARGYNCCNRTLRYSQFFSDFTRRQGSQVMHHQNNSFFIWERGQNFCQSFGFAHMSKFTVRRGNLYPHTGNLLWELSKSLSKSAQRNPYSNVQSRFKYQKYYSGCPYDF